MRLVDMIYARRPDNYVTYPEHASHLCGRALVGVKVDGECLFKLPPIDVSLRVLNSATFRYKVSYLVDYRLIVENVDVTLSADGTTIEIRRVNA